jgi:hypothetical protein
LIDDGTVCVGEGLITEGKMDIGAQRTEDQRPIAASTTRWNASAATVGGVPWILDRQSSIRPRWS